MRIFPIALIVIGTLGVAKHLGFIPVGMFHLIGPLFLIALGLALSSAARAIAATIGTPAMEVAAQTHRSHPSRPVQVKGCRGGRPPRRLGLPFPHKYQPLPSVHSA